MRINLSQVFSFSDNQVVAEVYNLSTAPINIVDIYFMTSDTAFYNFMLTPILTEFPSNPITGTFVEGDKYYNTLQDKVKIYTSGSWVDGPATTNMNAKLLICIDDSIFPIKIGYPGESPTNPINFTRKPAFSKARIGTYLGTTFDYIGGPDATTWDTLWNTANNQETANNTSEEISIGSNIVASDSLHIVFKVADGILSTKKKFGFGGSGLQEDKKTFIISDKDSFGGTDPATAKAIEAYGGIIPDVVLNNAIFVIQKSDYFSVEKTGFVTGSGGFGVARYGGGGAESVSAPGFGGTLIVNKIGSIDYGIRY